MTPTRPAARAAARSPLDRREVDTVLAAVGARLRAIRRAREVSIAELARTTGISASTLSRLESGGRRPTLELLLLLARAHGVALDDLVGAPETGDPRLRPRPVQRHGMSMLPLTRRLGGPQAYKLVMPPTPPGPPPELKTHEGHEWVYVLSGRLRVLLGDEDVVLEPGEAADFDTRTPHALLVPGPHAAEVLALFGPQGERVHLRARTGRRD